MAGRPVKHNSKRPRYWYFRQRYLAKKRGEKFSSKNVTISEIVKAIKVTPLPKNEIMTEAQWREAQRPPLSIGWNELSTGRSNS